VEDCASITATMLPKPTNWPLSTKTNKTSTTELLPKQQPEAAATPAQPHVTTDLILAAKSQQHPTSEPITDIAIQPRHTTEMLEHGQVKLLLKEDPRRPTTLLLLFT